MLPLISVTDVLKDTGTFPRTNTLECKIKDKKNIITFVQLKPRKLYDYGLLLVFVNKLMLFLG